ncbi:hypothetical protein Rsub_10624 [Raphidocelis subcapitata]|uniref:tRNA (guanine(10)-N(2))-methyltransferase n=1 Tax=Raphidocelis subcapitata TaxID=307507 RepID=A0A2V0PDM3_9CHLO|nr:hypothetical protein Rsub_10624 [Raphidocelis subcapitata]|eukprot:GBF97951.1 hypothetical protein Rsub_10624 [Raphidocelis subcapitata]
MGRTRRIRFKSPEVVCTWAGSDSDSGSNSDTSSTGARGASRAAPSPAAPPRAGRGPVRYLCYFAHTLLDFRVAEFEALAAMAGAAPGEVVWEPPRNPDSPFRFVTLPSRRIARHVAFRAVLLRALIEVWGEGPDWAALRPAVEAYAAGPRGARYLAPATTFRVKVDTWGFRWPEERKREVLQELEFVPFRGRVDLSQNTQVSFWAILEGQRPEVVLAGKGGAGGGGGQTAQNGEGQAQGQQQQQQQQQEEEEEVADGGSVDGRERPWDWIFFGREVALAASRVLPAQFTLKARRYLGPTSMDAEMAFVMANMAWCRPGSLVFDPYCGTGSLLLAAARFGSTVVGGDIDIRVIKLGKRNPKTGAVEDNFSNFEQYGLPHPAGLLRMDASRPPFRRGLEGLFHAIIGDPPYGVRAGGRKSHSKAVEIRDPSRHYASTAPYGLTECVDDLSDLAARLLVEGGRLVYFVPVSPETYDPSELPDHPALTLVSNCEQPLSGRYSRRLLTYAKTAPYDAAAAAAWRESRRGFEMAIERVSDLVWETRPERESRVQEGVGEERKPGRQGSSGTTGSGGTGGDDDSGGSSSGGGGEPRPNRQHQEAPARELAGVRL